MTREEAKGFVDSFVKLRDNVADQQASTVPSIYRSLSENGKLIPAGTRINQAGTLYRARVDLWDTVDYSPKNVPSLWEEISYKQGYRVITVITAENPFSAGEKGWFNDELYESNIANNVWTPETNPNGWKKVSVT